MNDSLIVSNNDILSSKLARLLALLNSEYYAVSSEASTRLIFVPDSRLTSVCCKTSIAVYSCAVESLIDPHLCLSMVKLVLSRRHPSPRSLASWWEYQIHQPPFLASQKSILRWRPWCPPFPGGTDRCCCFRGFATIPSFDRVKGLIPTFEYVSRMMHLLLAHLQARVL